MSLFVEKVEDGWGGFTYNPTNLGFTVLVLIMIALLILGCTIFGGKKKLSVKQLAFSALAISLAYVLSFCKIIKMPMGGSVTLLSMLCITLVGYWFGIGAGLTAAIAYGIFQIVQDPYIISLPQMFVDYIFAFGALGLSGLFSKCKNNLMIIPAYLVGVLGRYFFAFLSGWIFFGMYAPDNFNSAVVYSLCYNGAYLGLEAAITVVVLLIPPVRNAIAKVGEMAKE